MDFTPEQKREAFKKLPEHVREFMLSDEFRADLSLIGKNNSLLLDKLGLLEDEIFMVLYGLKQSAMLIPGIEKRLGISSAVAAKIGDEVSKSIFLKIRERMQDADNTPVPVQEKPLDERETILSEIENPIPTVHPISVKAPAAAEPAKDPATKSFVAEKLSAPVNKPAEYATDPYREPLM
ncbi:MAG TPA: hypothetical protein VHD69_03085 [Candidatus Paceibacterota bacterium]|jgi:hypothetical protein|nr:hypothetical protein [Candidatus Paceibacterota bacterium]